MNASEDGIAIDRAAKQLLHGGALLGVDFVPLGASMDVGRALLRPTELASSDVEADVGFEVEGLAAVGEKAEALAALRGAYESDASCAAWMIEGWSNLVFDTGDPDASVMFVGEAPGADEDRAGVPFVGKAGQLLEKMIVAMGLSRGEVYIGNVLKVRPPGNRDPLAEETAADGVYLRREISIVQPRVLVTLGKPSTNYLLGRSGALGEVRGSWQEYVDEDGRLIPLMPTYHPAYLLRSYTDENRRKVWEDLQAVMSRVGLG